MAYPFTLYYTVAADTLRSYLPTVPVLLTGASFERKGYPVPRLPPGVTERAADCGGFVATRRGRGRLALQIERYVGWLD